MTLTAEVRRGVADVRLLHDRPLHARRLLLTADLLGRTLEHVRGGRLDLVVLTDEDIEAGEAGGGKSVHSPDEAIAALGGRPDVVIEPVERAPASRVDHTPDAWILPVAQATAARLPDSPDPCVLRLALLRFRHQQPAALSIARLHRAEETLHRWRLKVADWADMPRALPDRHDLDALRHAVLDDLDTPTVLVLLHRLEMDARAPSGRRFETFAAIDRVLGLDLCHLVRSRLEPPELSEVATALAVATSDNSEGEREGSFGDDGGLGHDGGTAMGLAVEPWPPRPLTVPDTCGRGREPWR